MATDLGSIGDLGVGFKVDMSGLDSGVDSAKAKLNSLGDTAKKSADKASEGIGGMLKNALSFAAGQAIFTGVGDSLNFLKDQLGGVFQESMDAQMGMAQTTAALKSTHDASGMTAKAIADLAGAESHLTEFSDDTVQSAENMLLTFTNIGKNVFPQATKTVLDMSQALGQDTKSSAIQLGKALNDPISGITALQRVGVTFDQTQKDLIATYVQHGQTVKAQGVILKELQKEFGGTAEAAGKTLPGQLKILGQSFDDIKQNIGDALMPVVSTLLGTFEQDAMPVLNNFSDWFVKNGVPALKDLSGEVGPLVGDIEKFAGSLFDTVNKSGALPSVLHLIKDALPPLEKFVGDTANTLEKKLLPPTLSLIKNFSTWADKSGLLKDGIHLLSGAVQTTVTVVGGLVQKLSDLFEWLDQNKEASNGLKVAIEEIGAAILALKIAKMGTDLFHTIVDMKKNVSDFVSHLTTNVDKGVTTANAKIETIATTTGVVEGEVKAESAGMGTALSTNVSKGAARADAGIETIGVVGAQVEGEVAAEAAGMEGALSGVLGLMQSLAGMSLAGINIGEGTIAQPDKSAWEKKAGISQKQFDSWSWDRQRQYINDWMKRHPGQYFPPEQNVGFASGGANIAAGRYLVGERGPELMDVPSGANIWSNSQSKNMLQSAFSGGASFGGGTPVVHVHNDNRIYLDGSEMTDFIGQRMLKRIYASGPVKSGV